MSRNDITKKTSHSKPSFDDFYYAIGELYVDGIEHDYPAGRECGAGYYMTKTGDDYLKELYQQWWGDVVEEESSADKNTEDLVFLVKDTPSVARFCNIEELTGNFLNKTEETQNMTNVTTKRRNVVIEVIDPDTALDVADSLVIVSNPIITEDSDEVTIREWLMTGDLKEALEEHNVKRSNAINQDVLERTGNQVSLRPVKLKDLTLRVKEA